MTPRDRKRARPHLGPAVVRPRVPGATSSRRTSLAGKQFCAWWRPRLAGGALCRPPGFGRVNGG